MEALEVLSSEFFRRGKELMSTSVWRTEELIFKPAESVIIEVVERDLIESEEAKKIRIDTWIGKLEERKSILEAVNNETRYLIHPDGAGVPALYEKTQNGENAKMWAGITVTLAQREIKHSNNQIQVPVYPINYSEWIACQNPKYAEAFRNENKPLPYAGIGASVLMVTTDGFIPLTRRGIETPVYPGRLYPPGGGPKPGQSSTSAILSEVLEETGLKSGEHFDPSNLFVLGLVSDSNFDNSAHSRPEIVATLPLNSTFREVELIQHERSVKRGLKEEDVWAVEPITTFVPNLAKTVTYSGNEMCPPTEAGLSLFALFELVKNEGQHGALDKIKVMIDRMRSFKRVQYLTPIYKLKSLDV